MNYDRFALGVRLWRSRGVHRDRKGSVTVLSAFFLVVFVAALAFAIDLGHMYVVQAELQRSADSAALAAISQLVDDDPSEASNPSANARAARDIAIAYAAENNAAGEKLILTDADVDVGYLASPNDPNCEMNYSDPATFNAVTVRAPRKTGGNGRVPFIFARAFGVDSFAAEASATAVFIRNIKGFKDPGTGKNVPILPFAMDEGTWIQMLNGSGPDNWTWDEATGQAISGSDDIREINLYPQDTGASGNRGTVNIGTKNNGTSTVARQIVDGINSQDLAFHGGKLELNDDLELYLGGNPGISAGFKDELASIIGQPRIVPIFSEASGTGNNTTFTIVKWVGIRIVEVKLTGKNKRVIAQPAKVFAPGAVGTTSNSGQSSQFIYSSSWLAR